AAPRAASRVPRPARLGRPAVSRALAAAGAAAHPPGEDDRVLEAGPAAVETGTGAARARTTPGSGEPGAGRGCDRVDGRPPYPRLLPVRGSTRAGGDEALSAAGASVRQLSPQST